MINDDLPEITLIQGGLRTGKTLLMVSLIVKTLKLNPNKKIYTNFSLNNYKFEFIKKVNINTLLSLDINSILCFSEIWDIFDRRNSMKKENIKNTQNIQQIGKKQYKLFVDCFDVNMLDLRFSNQITRIIKTHGTLARMVKSKTLKELHPLGLQCLLNEMTKDNFETLFLYEIGKYDKEFNCFKSDYEFILIDGRDYFNEYSTHEILNKPKRLSDY